MLGHWQKSNQVPTSSSHSQSLKETSREGDIEQVEFNQEKTARPSALPHVPSLMAVSPWTETGIYLSPPPYHSGGGSKAVTIV